MLIAADRAIPQWEEKFTDLGEVRPYDAMDLKPESIRDADVLIVRTVTRVDAALLDGSSVRTVIAASAGTDHIDRECLARRGIRFAHAAGCNANSVSEYVVTALHVMASRNGWNLGSKSLAVVGVGQVGSRVAKKARALGMRVLLCDPPLRDATGDPQYRDLDHVLGADIVTFHVPLADDGPYPTRHMVGGALLRRLSPTQCLINTSRGAVVDSRELKTALREGRIGGAVLDVWEGEPRVDFSLLEMTGLGTPHIAGNSLDGKVRATAMAREALCGFLGVPPGSRADADFHEPRLLRPEPGAGGQEAVLSVLLQAFDLLKEDAGLRALGNLPPAEAAGGFERLRTRKPLRPEFCHFLVDPGERNIHLSGTFEALGFRIPGAGRTD